MNEEKLAKALLAVGDKLIERADVLRRDGTSIREMILTEISTALYQLGSEINKED